MKDFRTFLCLQHNQFLLNSPLSFITAIRPVCNGLHHISVAISVIRIEFGHLPLCLADICYASKMTLFQFYPSPVLLMSNCTIPNPNNSTIKYNKQSKAEKKFQSFIFFLGMCVCVCCRMVCYCWILQGWRSLLLVITKIHLFLSLTRECDRKRPKKQSYHWNLASAIFM